MLRVGLILGLFSLALTGGLPVYAHQLAEQTFFRPTLDGHRLDACYYWQRRCGKPVANVFCRVRGFDRAGEYRLARDIGRRGLVTRTLSGQYCNHRGCDAFRWVHCVRERRGDYLNYPIHRSHDYRRTQTFQHPKVHRIALDWCYQYGSGCGREAAQAFCLSKGFNTAVDYHKRSSVRQTYILGDKRQCYGRGCDSFRWVRCVR